MRLFGRTGPGEGDLPTPDQDPGLVNEGIAGERTVAQVGRRNRRPVGALLIAVAGCIALLATFALMADKPVKTPKAEQAASPLAPDSDRKEFRDRVVQLPIAPPPPVGGPPVLPLFTPPPLPKIEPRQAPARQDPDDRKRALTPQERRLQGGVSALSASSPTAGQAAGPTASQAGRARPAAGSAAGSRPAPGPLAGVEAPPPLLLAQGPSAFASGRTAPGAEDKEPRRNSLEEQLIATKTRGAKAGTLASMTMMLARGRLFECTLDTAVSSIVAGQVRCTIPLDVYGEDGKVVLLDRGTEIVGEYRSDMRKAQKRLGILWTRAKTPNGVLIDLDSPASDTLGRAGVDGFVETYFWERFGAAMMLSVLDDALSAIVRESRGSQNFYYGNTERSSRRMAEIALEDTVNIAPTLVKNQGETVQVFLARDLDFRSIYDYRQLGIR